MHGATVRIRDLIIYNISYQISPTCFGAYCTLFRENSLSLVQNCQPLVMLHWFQRINIPYIVVQSSLQLSEQMFGDMLRLKIYLSDQSCF